MLKIGLNSQLFGQQILTFSLSFPPASVLDDLKEFFFAMAKEARETILGPLSPKCSLLANIKAVLQRMLPENSYQLASGRLHISLTRVVDGQNVMASEFSSKEELIQVKGPSLGGGTQTLTTLTASKMGRCQGVMVAPR